MEYEYYTVMLGGDIFSSWRAVGEAESLATDTDIAKFLVDLYNHSNDKEQMPPGPKCSQCHSPLAFFCTSCHVVRLPSQSPPTAQPLPVQAQTFAGDVSLETLVVQQNLSSQKPTIVQSDAQHMQGEPLLIEAPSVVEQVVYVCDLQAKPGEWKTELVSELEETEPEDSNAFVVEQDVDTKESRMTRTKCFPKASSKKVNRPISGTDSVTNPTSLQSPNDKKFSCEADAVGCFEEGSSGRKVCDNGQIDQQVCHESTDSQVVNSAGKEACLRQGKEKGNLSSEVQTSSYPEKKKVLSGSVNSQASASKQVHKCPHCQKAFPHQNQSIIHLLTGCEKAPRIEDDAEDTDLASDVKESSSKERPFACHKCERTYLNKSDLRNHVLQNHPQCLDVEPFECNLCYRKFFKEKGLERHKEKEHPQGACLQCKLCDFKCRTYRDLYNHKKRTHIKEPKRQCEYCGVYFTRVGLKPHLLMHKNEKRFTCEDCGKKFIQKCGLDFHRRTHHAGIDRPYRCDQCGKGFLTERSLTAHIYSHTGEKPFPCPHCPSRFVREVLLKRHLKSHLPESERPYRCDHCGKGFVCQQGLTHHVRTHTGEKPFQCPQCPSKFAVKTYLNRHLKAYHEGPDKPYQCQECGKGFIKNQSLKDHMYSHSGEKPFQCPHCPSKFALKTYLNAHLETHPVEKQFECDICKRQFLFLGALNAHKKNAHGMK